MALPVPIDPDPPAGHAAADKTAVVRVRKLVTVLVWFLVVGLTLYFLKAVQTILLGTLAAAAVACMLAPLARRLPFARGRSAVVVGLGFAVACAGVVLLVGWLVTKPLTAELQRLPQSRQELDATLKGWSGQFQLDPPVDSAMVAGQVGRLAGAAGGVATGMANALVSVGLAVAFVFIGSIYFLAEPRDTLVKPLLPALPTRRRRQLTAALDALEPKLRWWLLGLFVSISVVAVVSGLGYWLAGLKFALPLALLAGLCELVPTVGPIVGGAVAVLVGATQGGSHAAGAVATWAVVQTVESYVLLPLVMKQAVRIPAVVTLFSVIFWGEVLGPAGLVLAVPLDLVVWEAFKHFVIDPDADGAGATTAGTAGDTEFDTDAAPTPVGRRNAPNAENELLEAESHPT
jgi:predicted PurR-regulated permease PerM